MKVILLLFVSVSITFSQSDSTNYFPFNPHVEKESLVKRSNYRLDNDSLLSLPLTRKNFVAYESQKKEKGVAIGYYLIMFGAGQLYAENGDAFLFFLLDFGSLVWLTKSGKDYEVPTIALVVSRLFELSNALDGVDEYNKNLLDKITLSANLNTSEVRLSYHLQL
ncbi:MAG: hypothetical protein H3C35_03515 [Bacteroidetes bacterium]|nr:hypothetical protein [Bacteroidota bacterium]